MRYRGVLHRCASQAGAASFRDSSRPEHTQQTSDETTTRLADVAVELVRQCDVRHALARDDVVLAHVFRANPPFELELLLVLVDVDGLRAFDVQLAALVD